MGSYIRKTRDEYHIETNYGYGWEVECVEESWKEAKERVKEYRENTTAAVRVRKRRVKVNPERSPVVWAGISFGWDSVNRPVPPVRAYLCFERDGIKCNQRLKGDSFLLAVGVHQKEVPVGILLDRLEEYPEEVAELPAEQVSEVVRELRRRLEV
jgi:hypothetical protein